MSEAGTHLQSPSTHGGAILDMKQDVTTSRVLCAQLRSRQALPSLDTSTLPDRETQHGGLIESSDLPTSYNYSCPLLRPQTVGDWVTCSRSPSWCLMCASLVCACMYLCVCLTD